MNFEFVKPEVFFEEGAKPFEPFKLQVEYLPKGFGETLANPLRRTLLMFMPGTAVIGFKIEGVFHKLDEIPNASTDTIGLMQNLKLVRFNMNVETDEIKTVKIKTKKAGPVYAKDLILPENVEVTNPEQLVIIVQKNEEFEAELYIQTSYGDKLSDEHTGLEAFPGAIAVDTVFSPIQQVGFKVRDSRNGNDAGFDGIDFTITADGSIEPKKAVEIAIYLMKSLFERFLEMSDIADNSKLYKEMKEERDKLMETPIELLHLSQRSFKALKNADILTVSDIAKLDIKTLGTIKHIGKTSVKEIVEVMKNKGIELEN